MSPVFINATDLIRSMSEPLLPVGHEASETDDESRSLVAGDGLPVCPALEQDFENRGSEEDAMDTQTADPTVEVEQPPVAESAMQVNIDTAMERLLALEALADRVQGKLNAFAAEDADATPAEVQTAEFGPLPSHETAWSDEPWDAAVQEVNVLSPEAEAYFALVYAWQDSDADITVKSSYRFIHHFVSEAGTPSAASMAACSAGIGVLNGARGGTTIPDGDREGVYEHLRRHLLDADREPPELLSTADVSIVAAAVDAGVEVDPTDHASVLAALDRGHEMAASEIDAMEVEVEEVADDVEAEISGLSALADDELIAELARRWAKRTAEAIEDEPKQTDPAAEATVDEGADMSDTDTVDVDDAVSAEFEVEGDGEASEPVAEAEIELPAVVELATDMEWEGVLIVEGLPSGDGRMVAEGALTWRELPIPLLLQTVNASGHDGAVVAGSIREIERSGQNIIGRGVFDSGEAGQEARRLLSEGTMRGVSADIDSVVVEFLDPDGNAVDFEDLMFGGGDVLEVLVEGRIMGATLTPFPAFQEAHVTVIEDATGDVALAASGAEALGTVWRVPSPIGAFPAGEMNVLAEFDALVASASDTVDVPASPPRDWFLPGNMTEPEPFRVHADGRCYGLIARWGSCHIGFSDRCVQVPRSGSAYKHFRNKSVLTAEGELVATGPIVMDTVHPNLRLVASDAQAFYADTGCGVADVAIYENEWGIVAAGAMRPGLTREQVRRFRGSDVSPDWRTIGGRLECVALLCVNASGFVVEGLVASGAEVPNARGVFDSVAGELRSLVAAGMVRHADTESGEIRARLDAQDERIAEIFDAIRPLRAERAKVLTAKMLGASDEGDCSCST